MSVSYAGGDGTDRKQAVQILGVSDPDEGLSAEWEYLSQRFGRVSTDFVIVNQTLLCQGRLVLDRVDIRLKSGERTIIYFDIAAFCKPDNSGFSR